MDLTEGYEHAQRRARMLPPESLLAWLDAALPGMMRHFDDYRRTGEYAHLGEVAMAHMTAGIVLDELIAREMERERKAAVLRGDVRLLPNQ